MDPFNHDERGAMKPATILYIHRASTKREQSRKAPRKCGHRPGSLLPEYGGGEPHQDWNNQEQTWQSSNLPDPGPSFLPCPVALSRPDAHPASDHVPHVQTSCRHIPWPSAGKSNRTQFADKQGNNRGRKAPKVRKDPNSG